MLSMVVRLCLMVLEYIDLPLCIGYHRILVRIVFRFVHISWDILSGMGISLHQFLCFLPSRSIFLGIQVLLDLHMQHKWFLVHPKFCMK